MKYFTRFFPDGRVEIFDYDKAREVGAEISVTARARGTATKIALPHKLTALCCSGQHLGMLPFNVAGSPICRDHSEESRPLTDRLRLPGSCLITVFWISSSSKST